MMNAMSRTLDEPIHLSVAAIIDGEHTSLDVDLPAGEVDPDLDPAVLAAVDDYLAGRANMAVIAAEPDEAEPKPRKRTR